MSIVAGLFRQVAPGLIDNLEAQGLFKGVSRSTPSLTPEMFIGGEGISNLNKAGMIDDSFKKTLAAAEEDWFKMPAEQWNEAYGKQGFGFDPVANKAMLEISDKNVSVRKGVDLNTLPENEFLGFDEVFSAETLKKAYPEISNIKIGFVDDPASSRLAAYDPGSESILFNRQNADWKRGYDPVKTALHEIQHYVQGKEMFTVGESFTGVLQENAVFQDSFSSLKNAISASPRTAIDFVKQNPKSGFNTDDVVDAIAGLIRKDGLSPKIALEKAFKSKAKAEKFMELASKNKNLDDILFLKDVNSTAYNQSVKEYMQVAGETFARQTEQRRDMSAYQRTANPVMRAVDNDAFNQAYGITSTSLTAPRVATQQQSFADPFAMQVPQSTIPEGM